MASTIDDRDLARLGRKARLPEARRAAQCSFFAGELGQRIFQQPFSWKAPGVDIRGRSRALRVNYRTSHQIRMQADRLLGPEVSDAGGKMDDRSDTVSVFNGPPPLINVLKSEKGENKTVSSWLSGHLKAGVHLMRLEYLFAPSRSSHAPVPF